MPASPAETLTATVNRVGADRPDDFQVFEISRPPSRHYDLNHSSVGSAAFGIFHPTNDDLRALADAADAELARRGAATPQRCKDPTLHAVADAPLRPLSDLLRTATEFVDADDDWYLREDRVTRLDALRAAVRALQGPPAPFRPQQAHAAPAICECVVSCNDNPRTACSLSGRPHVHPGDPCPVHPHAPGDAAHASG